MDWLAMAQGSFNGPGIRFLDNEIHDRKWICWLLICGRLVYSETGPVRSECLVADYGVVLTVPRHPLIV